MPASAKKKPLKRKSSVSGGGAKNAGSTAVKATSASTKAPKAAQARRVNRAVRAPKAKRAAKTGQIERTKNAVLGATIELLGEVAYGKITVDLISERSGASRSTIYRYWKTVPELVADAFDSAIDPDPPLPDVNDLETQLVLLFSELPRNLDGKVWGHLLPSLVAASKTDKDFQGTLQRISHRRRAGIRSLLRKAIKNGEIKADTNIEWVIDALSATSYLRHLVTGTSLHEKGHIAWLVKTVLSAVKTNN